MAYSGQTRTMFKETYAAILVGCILLNSGCREPEKAVIVANNPNDFENQSSVNKAQNEPIAKDQTLERKKQFSKMQESMHAVASIPSSQKGDAYDFHFVLPSDNWEKIAHGVGDQKSSVWLFNLKNKGLKLMLSCAGEKEAPEFSKSAMTVFESSRKKQPDLTREWKHGNFTLRRSFIGFIDERHGETIITAFSPKCTLEFNIASETMDRDELVKIGESCVEEFMNKNPDGGFPTK